MKTAYVNRRLTASVTLALLTVGCAVGPDYEQPAAPTVNGYTAEPLASESLGADQRFVQDMDIPGQWWTLFQSPKLNLMVEQALTANPNIDAAKATLRQSQELAKAVWASYLPNLGGNFDASRQKTATSSTASPATLPNGGLPPPIFNFYSTQLSLSYVPDVFGATSRSVESAQAQADNAGFQLEAAYLTLSSNVVATAVQEAALRDQVAATMRMAQLQHELTVIIERQRQIGTTSELDLLAQQSAEAQTLSALPPLQKQLAQTRDALTALLGRFPSEEPTEQFRLTDLTLPRDLPVTLPSKLVEQRPDVRAAAETLHAATAQVGVALASMLPQFAITGNMGTTGFALGNMMSPGYGFWTVGTSLSQTIFDGGALLHKRRAADAAMDLAAAQYRLTVITAFQNVADTLRALQADADAVKASTESVRTARTTLDMAKKQYLIGALSHVALLNAEEALLQAELILIQAQANRYSDTAGLFLALGGGWWHPKEVAAQP